jgi:hypothetical protein
MKLTYSETKYLIGETDRESVQALNSYDGTAEEMKLNDGTDLIIFRND